MNKSILVLEENSVVHGLVASALDIDGLTLHHEFNPAKYVERAKSLKPDLILLSNADQFNNYSICRQLKTGPAGNVPLVLLANSKDALDEARLRELRVDGAVRKPFEASDLQQQVSKHLNLPDLIGAAYEYRQSQSARDEVHDPLAQLDVLDDETVTMMKDAGGPGAGPGLAAAGAAREEQPPAEPPEPWSPAADAQPFSEMEIAADLESAGALDSGGPSAGFESPLETEPEVILPAAEGGLPPMSEAAFDDSDLAQMPPLEPEAEFEAPAEISLGAGDAERIEELGAEDLLDEEFPFGGQAGAPASHAAGARGGMQPSSLDQIDVELSEADLVVSAMEGVGDAEPDDMTLFEPEPGAPPAPSRGAEETVPLAVRRMMDLKPVLSPPGAPPAAAAPLAMEHAADAADLESVDIPPEALAEIPADGEADLLAGQDTAEISLGDELLDEEQILASMDNPPEATREEVEELHDDDLATLSLDQDDRLATLPAADLSAEAAAPEEDDEEISIDEDEEELILSSLEQERSAEDALRASPAAQLTREERAGLDEIMAVHDEQFAAQGVGQDEQEMSAMSMDAELELEVPAPEARLRPSPGESGARLDLPIEEELEVPEIPDIPLDDAAEGASLDLAPEPEPAAAGGDSDFDSELASLQHDIAAHPQGEHLDDVLRREGIQKQVAGLEFAIPQHEAPLARGLGLYAMPGEAPVLDPMGGAAPAAARPASVRPAQAAPPGAGDSLLDEATRARLGAVLDEIISISVRKAVREEMPRLVQRLSKDAP